MVQCACILYANVGDAAGGGGAGDMHVSQYAASQSDFQLRQYAQDQHLHQQSQQQSQQQQQGGRQLEHGHRSVREKRTEAALNDSAKRLYEAPGWRSTQGGWAADFGPPHTHALYTGTSALYEALTCDAAVLYLGHNLQN